MSLVITGKLEEELGFGLRDFSGEECGLTAIIGKAQNEVMTKMMQRVFHRGESGYGVYLGDLTEDTSTLDHFLGSNFNDGIKKGLKKDTSIFMGHCRYPTSGNKDSLLELQPFSIENQYGKIILAHNGNIENQEGLRLSLPSNTSFRTSSDSELFLHLISNSNQNDFESALVETLKKVKRAFSLIVLHKDNQGQKTFYAIKDINGIRPLDYHFNGENLFVSSENQAFLEYTNRQFTSLEPAQMLRFRVGESLKIIDYNDQKLEPRPCIFELIYFQRPSNHLRDGSSVIEFRKDLGRELYKEIRNQIEIGESSLVVPILRSGEFSARGFSQESKIQYKEALILNPNRDRERSFTAESDESRKKIIENKFIFKDEYISGKDLWLVDDSIVRGNTSKTLIQILREKGAKSVNYLSASPMIVNTCPYGMDFHIKKELIAVGRDLNQIRNEIGADSVHYLSFQGLKNVSELYQQSSFCNRCFKP